MQDNRSKYEERRQRKDKDRLKRQLSRFLRSFRNYAIIAIIIAAVVYGIYFLVKGAGPEGPDFSRPVPIMPSKAHVQIGTVVNYNSNPPTSGPHYDTPARPGFREEPIPDGYLVHSLEHGLVLVTYHPRIGKEAEKLREITGPFTVVVPRETNETDIGLSAWGRIDTFNLNNGTITKSDLDRIRDFVKRYANRGPERIPVGRHGGI